MTDTPRDEHVIEAIGKARVVIRDGKVISVGQPLISECPLARRFGKPVPVITPGAIGENMAFRIRSFGMCTPERTVEADGDYVGFGASELLSCGLSSGILDCAVIACDGAGTVIVTSPTLVQGIGGRMSGLVRTTPIPSVIARIREKGGTVCDPGAASIDQVTGVRMAREMGYFRIGVTVACPDEARSLRREYPETLVIAVHTTGVTEEEARTLAESADIVTACASRHVRDVAGKRALLQAGIAIPVFAMTQAGKDLILEKVRRSPSPVVISGSPLPFDTGQGPRPLV
jgi:putative methanogenesis marker protein 8